MDVARPLKVISLWQPWASAVAVAAKAIETRSWEASYVGLLAIHASARRPTAREAAFLHSQPEWPAALRSLGWDPAHSPAEDFATLPYGSIVAMTLLRGCRPSESFLPEEIDQPRLVEEGRPTWTERQMGDFTPGRFGWLLTLLGAVREPVPCRGRQRIFNMDHATETALFRQLTVLDMRSMFETLVGPLEEP